MTVDEFRESMDSDKAFQSKRKALVFISLLLLALVVSGAQIKEANTFIFKIEFSNHEGLRYLLVASVMVCMLRYYSYSERYRDQLFKIWCGRLLADRNVYYVDEESGEVSGLLGKRVRGCSSEYNVESPKYYKSGFLKRSVGLPASEMHDYYGQVYFTKYISLNEYSGNWTSQDFRRLLLEEFKYRVEAWVKYRETLDLASPYMLATASLVSFVISYYGA